MPRSAASISKRSCWMSASGPRRRSARWPARSRALELDLRKAIANGEFEVYYQPIIDLQGGKAAGLEALLRWNHPERGMISPAEFIPLAEETGLILPLGEWVLRTACLHASKWPKRHQRRRQPVGHAVQGPQHRAADDECARGVRDRVWRLDLEITESVLLQDEANTLATLHQLRELGVKISMDDFGTGYSSLATCATSRSTRSRSTAPSSMTCWCGRIAGPSSAR